MLCKHTFTAHAHPDLLDSGHRFSENFEILNFPTLTPDTPWTNPLTVATETLADMRLPGAVEPQPCRQRDAHKESVDHWGGLQAGRQGQKPPMRRVNVFLNVCTYACQHACSHSTGCMVCAYLASQLDRQQAVRELVARYPTWMPHRSTNSPTGWKKKQQTT